MLGSTILISGTFQGPGAGIAFDRYLHQLISPEPDQKSLCLRNASGKQPRISIQLLTGINFTLC